MSYLKRAAIISLFFLIGTAFAAEDLVINADNIEFDKEQDLVEATGSVSADYKGLNIKAGHLIYRSAERRVSADGNFVMTSSDRQISGSVLDYYIDTKEGTAEKVSVLFRGINLAGDHVRIGTEEVSLDSASFSSCDLADPHYRISASSITLYPTSGWLALYWGWFYLWSVPVFPVPTYIYDVSDGRKKNRAPMPEFGANPEDGTFVTERLSWHSTNKVYGAVLLTYAEKKGPGGGFEMNLEPTPNDLYFGRIGTNQTDGWWGGVTYSRFYVLEIKAPVAGSMFNIPIQKRLRFDIDLSSRERINFQRISKLPEISLSLDQDIFLGEIGMNGMVSWGSLYEESTMLDTNRTSISGRIYHYFPETVFGIFELSSDFFGNWYGQGSRWARFTGTLGLDKKWNDVVESGTGYRHPFVNDGISPFTFENYRLRISDEYYVNAYVNLFNARIGAQYEYYVPSWDGKDFDYSISSRLHCFDVAMTYRALRNEINWSVGLVTQ